MLAGTMMMVLLGVRDLYLYGLRCLSGGRVDATYYLGVSRLLRRVRP